MKITAGILGVWRMITLRGRLTVKNVTLVRRYFERTEEHPFPGVVLDMSGVEQLDSSGITLLVNFQRRLSQLGGMVVIAGLPDDIAEIFSIVGIDTVFTICSTMDEFRRQYVE